MTIEERETLPEGWIETTLGDLLEPTQQRVPNEDEEFEYIDIASIDRQTKKITAPQHLSGKDAPSRARKVVQTNDVLVSMTRPNLNAVAIVGSKLNGQIASTGFDVLRSEKIEPRWIFGFIRTANFVENVSEIVRGALYPAVSSSEIRAFEIPFPPLAEQIRIADKLDALLSRVDAGRERLERMPKLVKRFRQSVLSAAVSGELTREWRGGGDPQWEEVELSDCASDFTYGSSNKSEKSGAVPVLRMGNIQSGNLDWSDLVLTLRGDKARLRNLSAYGLKFSERSSECGKIHS